MGGIVEYIITLGRGATPQVGERLMSTSSLSADAEDESTDVAGTGTGTNAAAVSNSMFGTISGLTHSKATVETMIKYHLHILH